MVENVLIMQNAWLVVTKVFVNVQRDVQTTLLLAEFVPVMGILTRMNVNSRELRVNNRRRYKLNTKDLAVSIGRR